MNLQSEEQRDTLIGIGQMSVSRDRSSNLCAPNLGSCVALSVYDPFVAVGGMIHCLLPSSKNDLEKAAERPTLYVDTGVVLLLQKMMASGASKEKLIIKAVGGAQINDDNNIFEIGKKNVTMLRKVLWKNGLLLASEHFGDCFSRTLTLDIETGETTLKINGHVSKI